MKIEIEDMDQLHREVVAAVANQILYSDYGDSKFAREVEEKVDAMVREQCEKALREVAVEQLTPRVQALLDENTWTVFDGGYGDQSRKTDLKTMLAKFLEPPRYNSTDHFVAKLVDTRIKETFAKEFEPIIKAAGAELRKRLDTILGEKVSLAVREAVGLK